MQVNQAQIRISATYMRGGTSKGLFFDLADLPAPAQAAGAARDAVMLRIMGSPDPYGQQIDGMGGATSSTSKAVLLSQSNRPGHDVDYLFAQVAVDQALVDWSGNCGNLTAAVGPYAIRRGWVDAAQRLRHGVVPVRIWQANIGQTIVAHVPMRDGEVQEIGDFALDGVTFPAAEIRLEFLGAPVSAAGNTTALFPSGQLIDTLEVPGIGQLEASLVDAGIATVFVDASALGFTGTESQRAVNADPAALAKLEAVRAIAAVRMGLIDHPSQAVQRQHTPKLVLVAPPADYLASSGKRVAAADIDLLVRAVSMGKLHHALMGTAAVAVGAAAAVPGTLVHRAAGGAGRAGSVCCGHPSGTLRVGAQVQRIDDVWRVTQVTMSRSARRLMEGWVYLPDPTLFLNEFCDVNTKNTQKPG